ncbi:hypothetical protein [Chondromyces apiculatus]|uniref:Uncharacterized protein n=1 Tax=Chondromyces apiculatus DSM 436 TaxID=1192034 RepID=A0A017T6Z6_9BACT|nr:hypothetical protein [Chondromyces apiculatus]EYF04366.1 Hypothetical protein CAP_4630 [Chondromyces apiculatus DSM 436]
MRSMRQSAGVALLAVAGLGCGGGVGAPPGRGLAREVPTAAPIGAPGPVRYATEASQGWVEDLPGGGQRLVVSGRRMERRGLSLTALGALNPELQAGAAAPAWLGGGGKGRYVFWREREVFAAAQFDGDLVRVAELPGEVIDAFMWLDGVGLLTQMGLYVVKAADGVVRPLGVPGAAMAAAGGAQHGVVLTVFGQALFTGDGGRSFRDLGAALAEPVDVTPEGDALRISLSTGSERWVRADGRVEDAPEGEAGVTSASRAGGRRRGGGAAAEVDPGWPEAGSEGAMFAAVEAGVPLGDGGAVAIEGETVGRVDLATGRATAAAQLPEGSGSCVAFRAPEGVLALCAGDGQARVISLSGAPRIEREFEMDERASREGEPFVGVDGEALAFAGPCEGRPRPRFDMEALAGSSGSWMAARQSPVICARVSPGVWRALTVDAADATDLLAWVPRPGGAATAIVGRSGVSLGDEPRVMTRGDLRVIRVARDAPPLVFPRYRYDAGGVLSRALRARGGGVEGFFPVQAGSIDRVPVVISDEGKITALPLPPRTESLATAGGMALAQTDEGRFFETVDRGRSWVEVAPSPGDPASRASGCSPVGCRLGSIVRVGWASLAPEGAPAVDAEARRGSLSLLASRQKRRRGAPPGPFAQIACSFAGAPEGARLADSYGFGVTPTVVAPGSGHLRVGSLGSAMMPWSSMNQGTPLGEVPLSWLVPLEVWGRVRRATVKLDSDPTGVLKYRASEAQVGFFLDRAGKVVPVAAGVDSGCFASLLDDAGITWPVGGCVARGAVGAALADRLVMLAPSYRGLSLSTVSLPAAGRVPVQRDLATSLVPRGMAARYTFGAGVRAGAPVFVVVDGTGEAALAEVDLERGRFRAASRLVPLAALRLGSDPACAPRASASPAANEEVRVVLPFSTEIGLAPGKMPGVTSSGTAGVAVIRWSATTACLDAVEMSVRDERYEAEQGFYDPPGTVKKVVAHFAGPEPAWSQGGDRPGGVTATQGKGSAIRGAGSAALVLVTYGQEVRQPLTCRSAAP